jgi:hypothetical protein
MRALRLAVLAVFLPAAPGSAQDRPAPRVEADCESARSEEAIRSAERAGEVVLASGRVARLAGLRIPDDDGAAEGALAWTGRFAGRTATLVGRGEADRWGRIPGRLLVGTGGSRLDLAETLVEEGLALVDPGEADRLCHPELLALEATARERGLGLWGGDRYKPVEAGNVERLLALAGRFALVEGRVRSVGERRERTYLNFGTDWDRDLTITIPKRTWAMMRDAGLTAESFKGRRIRGRGVVEDRRGPALEITAPDLIEFLDGGRARR